MVAAEVAAEVAAVEQAANEKRLVLSRFLPF